MRPPDAAIEAFVADYIAVLRWGLDVLVLGDRLAELLPYIERYEIPPVANLKRISSWTLYELEWITKRKHNRRSLTADEQRIYDAACRIYDAAEYALTHTN